MSTVLDASALLAFLHDEPGAAMVSEVFHGARVSTVNWSEVLQKSLHRQVVIDGMQQEFMDVGVVFEPFTAAQAEMAARLWAEARGQGLSLADRACLALASELNATVFTADRVWSALDLGVDIRLIR